MSTHSAPDRRGPDLGLGVFRASCSEPKAPRPLLAPASSKPLCPESLRWCLSCLCFPQPGCRALAGVGGAGGVTPSCTALCSVHTFPETHHFLVRLSQAVSNLT